MKITDEMVAAAIMQLGFTTADSVRIRAALEAALSASDAEPVLPYRPTYQQIKDIVQANVNRMREAGESHLMMSRWLSADLDKVYPAAPPAVAVKARASRSEILAAVNAKLIAVNEKSYGNNRGDWRMLRPHDVVDAIDELLNLSAHNTSPEPISETPKSEHVIPEGWQLVPKVPTDAWAETYCGAVNRHPDGVQATSSHDGWVETTFREMAKREITAMLAAAPEASHE